VGAWLGLAPAAGVLCSSTTATRIAQLVGMDTESSCTGFCGPHFDVARFLLSSAAMCIMLSCRVWGKLFEAAAAAKADFDAASLTSFLWAANTAGAPSAAASAATARRARWRFHSMMRHSMTRHSSGATPGRAAPCMDGLQFSFLFSSCLAPLPLTCCASSPCPARRWPLQDAV
jgi:hypothetical protein